MLTEQSAETKLIRGTEIMKLEIKNTQPASFPQPTVRHLSRRAGVGPGLYSTAAYGTTAGTSVMARMNPQIFSGAATDTEDASIDGSLNGVVDWSAFHRLQPGRATILISARARILTGACLGTQIHINGFPCSSSIHHRPPGY